MGCLARNYSDENSKARCVNCFVPGHPMLALENIKGDIVECINSRQDANELFLQRT